MPFFLLRVDNAGNVPKQFSSGTFPFSKFGGTCPLWNVHSTFDTPDRLLKQVIELPDGTRYFSIAQMVRRPVAHTATAAALRDRLGVRNPHGENSSIRSTPSCLSSIGSTARSSARRKVCRIFTSLSLFCNDVERLLRDLYGDIESEALVPRSKGRVPYCSRVDEVCAPGSVERTS